MIFLSFMFCINSAAQVLLSVKLFPALSCRYLVYIDLWKHRVLCRIVGLVLRTRTVLSVREQVQSSRIQIVVEIAKRSGSMNFII